MSTSRTYPHGVPSWVDTDQPDPEAARDFYAALFGWTLTTVSPPDAPLYVVASREGRDLAGLAASTSGPAVWNTYIAVDDAQATAAVIRDAGGEIVIAPFEVGPAGRMAVCRDPAGGSFRLWQAGQRAGAEVVNEPGTWNFSDLHTDQPDTLGFYAEVFGWEVDDLGFATLVRRPGYGDHLEATVDPGIRSRQERVGAPPGFEDAIAWVTRLEPGSGAHWQVSFSVADRDEVAGRADELGAEVLSSEDTRWVRTALIRDPQGAVFTASQFTPPE